MFSETFYGRSWVSIAHIYMPRWISPFDFSSSVFLQSEDGVWASQDRKRAGKEPQNFLNNNRMKASSSLADAKLFRFRSVVSSWRAAWRRRAKHWTASRGWKAAWRNSLKTCSPTRCDQVNKTGRICSVNVHFLLFPKIALHSCSSKLNNAKDKSY